MILKSYLQTPSLYKQIEAVSAKQLQPSIPSTGTLGSQKGLSDPVLLEMWKVVQGLWQPCKCWIKNKASQAWRCMPEIPSLNRARQENLEVSLRATGWGFVSNKRQKHRKAWSNFQLEGKRGCKPFIFLASPLLIEPSGRLEMKKNRAVISKIEDRKQERSQI